MKAADALASYRQTHSASFSDALESFKALSLEDQLELLFWISMHTNNQLMPLLKKAGIPFTTNRKPERGN